MFTLFCLFKATSTHSFMEDFQTINQNLLGHFHKGERGGQQIFLKFPRDISQYQIHYEQSSRQPNITLPSAIFRGEGLSTDRFSN